MKGVSPEPWRRDRAEGHFGKTAAMDGEGTHKIVVGVDGSDSSRAALRWALEQAKVVGAELEAVLAFSFELAWIDVGSDYQATWIEEATQRAREQLHGVLDEVVPEPRPVAVHPLVVEGSPATVLVDVARSADLLVVGARGRGGFAGLLLGSVSQRCVERASCPVVVVPNPS
jgi:nucleotide-binding universal stress UspA family protein